MEGSAECKNAAANRLSGETLLAGDTGTLTEDTLLGIAGSNYIAALAPPGAQEMALSPG
jgi:hypothetical protein